MRLLREAMTSFAGGVNDSAASDEYLPHQAQVLVNARPSLLGNAVGWADFGEKLSSSNNWSTGLSSGWYTSGCFGAIEFYTSAGVQQIVAAFDDEMHYSLDGGRTFTLISGATGLDMAYWSFAIINEGGTPILCCANGDTASYEWDGTTWSTIANIPSGVKYLAVHANRLVASGYSGAQVAASKVGDIETWATPDGWVVNADDGSDGTDVTGLYTLGGLVLVFKRRSFGYTEGYGYQTLQVAAGARGVSRSVGCVAHRTIVAAGDGALMWLSERGFEFWTPGSAVLLVSNAQQRFVDKIGWDAIRRYPGLPSAMWVPSKQEYWCVLPLAVGAGPTLGETHNTWTYIFRPATSTRPPAAYFRYPTRAGDGTLSVGTDGMLGIGTADLTGHMGFVDEHGMLDVCKLPDPGLWAELDPSMLNLRQPLTGPSTLFTANTGAAPAAPHAGTHDNGILRFDVPSRAAEMIIHGDMSAATYWGVNGGVTVSGGVATFPGTAGTKDLYQLQPVISGRIYRIRFNTSARTKGTLSITIGVTSTSISANGPQDVSITASSGIGLGGGLSTAVIFSTSDEYDGVLDNISMIDETGDETAQIAIVRTRPFTFGDEFTRKKAKRIAALIKQPFAHTVTAYALVDGSYQTARSLAYTASDAPQEQRARVGGRGRVIQAEFHISAESIVDGIEVVAQPLGDEI